MNESVKIKLKIIGIIVGVTGVVFLTIKFLLPLVTPFVLAFILAALLNKPITFLTKKARLGRGVAAFVVMALFIAGVGAGVFFGGKILCDRAGDIFDGCEKCIDDALIFTEDCCCDIDRSFGMSEGSSFSYLEERMADLENKISGSLMDGSKGMLSQCVAFLTAFTFFLIAFFFLGKDFESIKEKAGQSVFGREIDFFGRRMKRIFGTFIKTQLIIMLITCTICWVGLWLLKNPYAFLAGMGIGLMDALPVLGTGTVFVPWVIILIVMKNYQKALWIFVIYVICYGVRQFLEPKLMADKFSISPVVMLIALYAGLLLFGISGVITGPIGAVIIKEISAELIKKLVET